MASLDMDSMGKMVGPLPLGAWIATVGGGLAFMFYQRRQSEGIEIVEPDPWSEGAEDVSGVPGVGNGSVGGWIPTGPAEVPGSVASDPVDNEQWSRMAINHLIASNYDPNVADSAIRKYMGGESLGASEYALIAVALAKLGSPPIPLPPPLFGPPTMPKPGVSKPIVPPKPAPVKKPNKKINYYTVKPGQTLSGIAKRHNRKWQDVYNANRKGKRRADGSMGMIANPNILRPGWKLILP